MAAATATATAATTTATVECMWKSVATAHENLSCRAVELSVGGTAPSHATNVESFWPVPRTIGPAIRFARLLHGDFQLLLFEIFSVFGSQRAISMPNKRETTILC